MKRSKKADIKDSGELVESIVSTLVKKRRVRVAHFGVFELVKRKGRLRYDAKKDAMVPYDAYRTILFRPAAGLRALINEKKGGRSP